MEFLLYAYVIPLGSFILIICLLALALAIQVPKDRTGNNRDPRLRELELLNRMYALEAEHAHSPSFVPRNRGGNQRPTP